MFCFIRNHQLSQLFPLLLPPHYPVNTNTLGCQIYFQSRETRRTRKLSLDSGKQENMEFSKLGCEVVGTIMPLNCKSCIYFQLDSFYLLVRFSLPHPTKISPLSPNKNSW